MYDPKPQSRLPKHCVWWQRAQQMAPFGEIRRRNSTTTAFAPVLGHEDWLEVLKLAVGGRLYSFNERLG